MRDAAKRLSFAPAPASQAEVLVALQDVSIAHANQPAALAGVALAVTRRMRLIVLGPNGGGKSSLLRAMAGRIKPSVGTRAVGRGVQLLHFAQEPAALDEEESPVERLVRVADGAVDEDVALEVLTEAGLDRFAAQRCCACLSSGERQLVALASLTLTPRNCLLLDDPLTCLDAASVDALAVALAPAEWDGALVVTSGGAATSRRFCAALKPTHTAVVSGGGVTVHARSPSEEDWASCAQDGDSGVSKRAAESATALTTSVGEGSGDDEGPKRARRACGSSSDPPL